MIKHFRNAIIIIFIFYSGVVRAAKDLPVTARLFAGLTKVSPGNLNTEMTAQGLKNIKDITQFGIEATVTPFRYLDFGLRYTKRYVNNEESPADPLTAYSGQIDQDSVLLLARLPVVRTQFFRADIFGGVGGSNTTFTIKSAAQNGELVRKDDSGWFASPYSAYGGSVGVGYKKFYLVAEGGMENNKVSKFKRTGNVNSNVTTIDLSGSYFMVGLMFDGLSPSKK
jgi:hypothetical protein